MNNLLAIYGIGGGRFVNGDGARGNVPTPPCKLIDNHKVISLDFVYGVTAWPIIQPSV